ncbi:hypothetical protein PPYR_14529 [Photinus pyralis]|uniref:PiggyBac transposable element-derived protein domain-containing protein n=2 Tax=Photinus pyralis TaxID=7054 RepID=A0A5N4A5H0_PHOPY|nr:hypothetical protein PPYR_14529 [Photinus pyralis]
MTNIPVKMMSPLQYLGISNYQKKKKTANPVWTKDPETDISTPTTRGCLDRLTILKAELEGRSPVEIFKKFIDKDVIDHIVFQSNLYAQQKNDHRFMFSESDMKIFLGFLLLTGYHSVPRESMYWSLDEDLGIDLVTRSMSRNRFHDIKRNIHLADNTNLKKGDKMAKVRPLMDLMNQRFQQWGFFHEELSIDERAW